MKYIIIPGMFGDGLAVLFDECANHKDVAGNQKVLSAGFCSLAGTTDSYGGYCERTYCWGKSVTLGIGSRQEDVGIIDRAVKLRL